MPKTTEAHRRAIQIALLRDSETLARRQATEDFAKKKDLAEQLHTLRIAGQLRSWREVLEGKLKELPAKHD
jgi:hypothetical protein